MMSRCIGTISWTVALMLAILPASANERVGKRLFAATLAIDDPGANDELIMPFFSAFTPGGNPAVDQFNVAGAYAKTITRDFAVGVHATWTRLSRPGGPTMTGAFGAQNLETTFKYRFYRNLEREFVFSGALNIEWAGTGAARVGAEPFNVYMPTLYVGQGFGGLPHSLAWARPFAITGQFGYAIPGAASRTLLEIDPVSGMQTLETEFHPKVLAWGGTLQYSMAYLKAEVVDLGLPDFVNRLVPIIEAAFRTPVSNTATSGTVTTGTINPGIAWIGEYYQISLEAVIPINRQSGRGIGVMSQLHFHLDEVLPTTLGRPIFASRAAAED